LGVENLDVKIGPGANPTLAAAGGERGAAVGTGPNVPGADASMKGKEKMEGTEGQLALVVNTGQTDDDEYVFEEDEEAMQVRHGWMAVARYYSSQDYSTWGLFSELSKAWGRKEPVPVRELGANRFLITFDSEKLWRKVLGGGPWKHKKDAVIFAPYDGFQRLSEVSIDSIALWVRIYDIPIHMITEGFARALGAKIGRVLEVGRAIMDYKRVRVDFPLANPLMPVVCQKVRGSGEMMFKVRYENVPNFCFGCGRIGHAQEDCPDENLTKGGVIFAKALQCSPQKNEVGRSMTIPSGDMGARRGLNFCGEQRERVLSTGSTSVSNNRKRDVKGNSHAGIPAAVSAELVKGVQQMAVVGIGASSPVQQSGSGCLAKVSGLNSYMGSSDKSGSSPQGSDEKVRLNMQERRALTRKAKDSVAGDKKLSVKGAMKDLDKPKNRRVVNPNILGSLKELEKHGLDDGILSTQVVHAETDAGGNAALVKEGESPVKRSRVSTDHNANLTGAHEEARQEQ